jgi:hypothetical protein
MNSPTLITLVALGVWLAPALAAAQAPVAAPWTGPRTPDGQPNIQGTYDAPLTGSFSLENPMAGGGRFPFLAEGKPLPVNPSRVIDPPTGKVPYLPWAAAKRADQEAHIENPLRPEHLDIQNRCLPHGVARGLYTTSARFLQFPDYVVILFDQYQYFRIVRLNAPHVGSTMKLWLGDPVGRWEGNTLVVETTNVNGKSRLSMVGDFYSENARIVERFTFPDAKTLNYQATFEDPTVFSRPWTMAVAMQRQEEDEFWEYGCWEGEKTSEHLFPRETTGSAPAH